MKSDSTGSETCFQDFKPNTDLSQFFTAQSLRQELYTRGDWSATLDPSRRFSVTFITLKSSRTQLRPSVTHCTLPGIISDQDRNPSACYSFAHQYLYITPSVCKMPSQKFDYDAVRASIRKVLNQPGYDNYDQGTKNTAGPVLVRLAWHAAGTYGK